MPDRDQNKAVGAALADARRRVGLTQNVVATRLGRPQSFVAKVEGGERRVDVPEFIALSEALGLSATALLSTVAKRLRSLRS